MTLVLLVALPSLAAGQLASSVSATAEASPDTTAWTTDYDEAVANPYPRLPDVLAWRQHDGGHTDGPNWRYFIPWADRMLAPGHKP